MRDIIEAAQRLLCGATYSDRIDQQVEIVNCGTVHTIDTWRFKEFVTPLYEQALVEFMYPRGYSPPLDSEAMISLFNYLSQASHMKAEMASGVKRTMVLFLINEPSGCSYWRCEEPARLLSTLHGDEFYVDVTAEVNFDQMLLYDVIVVQRGLFGQNSVMIQSLVAKLKAAGKKIVYEIDDDLRHVPATNSVFFVLDPLVRRFVSWLEEISDGIFCSTETLRDMINRPQKTHVLPNSIDFGRFKPVDWTVRNENLLHVNWHGGESHQADIDMIGKELYNFVANRRPELEKKTGKKIVFSTFGYLPQQMREYLTQTVSGPIVDYHIVSDPVIKKALKEQFPDKNMNFIVRGRYDTRHIQAVHYREFHQMLIDIEPDICICPLVPDEPFNSAKSNIKWIESTLAGAACVVTQMNASLNGVPLKGPFDDIPDDCVIKARTPGQIFQGVQELILDPTKRRALWRASSAYVQQHYDLRRNAGLWAEALHHVAWGPSEPPEHPREVPGHEQFH